MADKPCVCFLIIQRNLKFIQKIAHKGNNGIVPFILQEALLGIHNAVAAFGIKADRAAVLALPHGELCLIAVAPRRIHADGRSYGHARNAADAFEVVLHLLCFIRKLRRIGKVLQLASAALLRNRTAGLSAVGRGGQDFQQLAIAEMLSCLYNQHKAGLSGQCPLYKDGIALYPPDALAITAQCSYFDFIRFILLYRNHHLLLLFLFPKTDRPFRCRRRGGNGQSSASALQFHPEASAAFPALLSAPPCGRAPYS